MIAQPLLAVLDDPRFGRLNSKFRQTGPGLSVRRDTELGFDGPELSSEAQLEVGQELSGLV